MKPKTKAFLLNFLCFGLIFITLRFAINYFLPELNDLLAIFIVGFTSVIISPRFAAVKKQNKEVVLMKWFFSKDLKEI